MATFSQTHRIRYDVIRDAAGITYGSNHWDYVDPRVTNTLAGVIGKAGINLTEYAAFLKPSFSPSDEVTDRSTIIPNFTRVYFVHRGLLDLLDQHILERWTTR